MTVGGESHCRHRDQRYTNTEKGLLQLSTLHLVTIEQCSVAAKQLHSPEHSSLMQCKPCYHPHALEGSFVVTAGQVRRFGPHRLQPSKSYGTAAVKWEIADFTIG